MSLVLDASMTVAWYFEDESDPAVDAALEQVSIEGAVVPSLWPLEVANAFLMAVRRKRISADYRDAAFAQLALLPVTIDIDTARYGWGTTLKLADRFALTLYDATYLELAQRRNLPLATLNQPLREAARGLDIPVLG